MKHNIVGCAPSGRQQLNFSFIYTNKICLKGVLESVQHTLGAQSTRPPLAGIPTLPIEFGDVITPFVRLYKYTVQHSTTMCVCLLFVSVSEHLERPPFIASPKVSKAPGVFLQ